MVKAAIVNVTGYAGVELARLLARHPDVEITEVTGRSRAGERLADAFPHLADLDLEIVPKVSESADVVFVALPHTAAAEAVPDLLDNGARIVDISADFRLHDAAVYENWYKTDHPAKELLSDAVYGLPELHADEVRSARIVANPGCYPTGAILALAPVAEMTAPDIIIDSKSGVSGGGRSPTLTNHYSEVNESCHAYGLGGHRHLPEIEQELAELRSKPDAGLPDLCITFVPHLVPMTRGILTTAYARLEQPLSGGDIESIYTDFYRNAPFVRVVDQPPRTKQAWGSNFCLVHPTIDARTGRLLVIAAIDNLVKGASGQAIQNMNLMFGLDETASIGQTPIYP